jgi:sulfotransferase
MQNGIHFISGLPRSGSTLLAAIQRQNPRFSRRDDEPGWRDVDRSARERHGPTQRSRGVYWRGVTVGWEDFFANYYNEIQNEKRIFDTNRVWSAKLPALSELFPKTRVVCCVRDAPWIIDSIERVVRGNVFELSGVFGFEPRKCYIRRELARRRPTDRAGLYRKTRPLIEGR